MVKRTLVVLIATLWLLLAAFSVTADSPQAWTHTTATTTPLPPTPVPVTPTQTATATPEPAITPPPTEPMISSANQQTDPRPLYVLGALAVAGVTIALSTAWYRSHRTPREIGN